MIRSLALAVMATVAVLHGQSAGLSVVLLIDVTASVSDAMARLALSRDPDGTRRGVKAPNAPRDLFLDALERGFIANLAPADRARVGRVARDVRLSEGFTNDRAALRAAVHAAVDIAEQERHGPSPLWDAVLAGVQTLDGQPGRRAVVLVTDGLSTGNRHSLASVVEQAKRASIAVAVVGEWFGTPRPRRSPFKGWVGAADEATFPWRLMLWPFENPPGANLKRLAAETGGVFVGDGEPLCGRAWAQGDWCGTIAQQSADDCGAYRRNRSDRYPQCAGEDPNPEIALASILEHLHRP